jgi:hypothetical protein
MTNKKKLKFKNYSFIINIKFIMNFDADICLSFKNKYSNTQCPNSKKYGQEFCGVHLKSKNVRRVDNPHHWIPQLPELQIPTYTPLDKLPKLDSPPKVFEPAKSTKIDIDKVSDKDIDDMMVEIPNNYTGDELKSIIKVQSICRRWLARRRYLCNNKEDFFQLVDLFEIPNCYFFTIKDGNLFFGFDFRSFYFLSKKFDPKNNETYNSTVDNIKNPFTNTFLSEKNKEKYTKHLNYMMRFNVPLEFPKRKLTSDELLRNKIVDVFQKIDFLDNYTDVCWFEELDLKGLKKLYTSCEDIFNYRCNFTDDVKKRIIHDGVIFNMNKSTLEKLTDKHKKFIQNILLDEFNRLCTEGQSTEDRKLGAILILTALTEVSKKAAQALPHIAQSSYINEDY